MKGFVSVLLIILGSIGYAQEKIIALKNDPIDMDVAGFYISDVIDGRKNQENIGFAQVGMFNRVVDVDLEGGVEKSVFNYLTESLPMDTLDTPIVLKIVYLYVSEKTSMFTETGRAEIKVEFYKASDGKLGKIYGAEALIEEPGADVTRGHEKRIRSVLTTCINSFNNSDWRSIEPEFIAKESIVADRMVVSETSLSNVSRESIRWNSLLTFNRTFGINANGWGLTYYGYAFDETSDWIIPMVIAIEGFTIDTDYFRQFKYQKASLNYWMPGISAFKELGGNIYANLTLLIPVGNETLTDFYGNETDGFLIGLAPAQGIYYIPKSNFGITLGIGMYQRLLTSKVYKSDFGFKAEIGLKF